MNSKPTIKALLLCNWCSYTKN